MCNLGVSDRVLVSQPTLEMLYKCKRRDLSKYVQETIGEIDCFV